MTATYNVYKNEPTQWGRGADEALSHRVSLEELRFLGSRGVDVDEFYTDERLARDMRSAERIAGQLAVSTSMEAQD